MAECPLIVDPARSSYAFRDAAVQTCRGPLGQGDADYRDVQGAALHHCIKGRKNHLVGEIARDPEEYQRVRTGASHQSSPFSGQAYLHLPPKWVATADRNFTARMYPLRSRPSRVCGLPFRDRRISHSRTRAFGIPLAERQIVVLHSLLMNATVCSVTDGSTRPKPLTELQQAILDFVWSNGTATAEQVREAIALKHPLKE